MAKATTKRQLRDDATRIVAEIHGVSTSLVKKVRSGDRNNEAILETLIEYQLGKNRLIKNLQKLVPIKPQPEKYAR